MVAVLDGPRTNARLAAALEDGTLPRMSFRDKILAWDDVPAWREEQRRQGRRVVVTNGCFDLLHVGHVSYLEGARSLGDLLLVGVNSDASVRELKGPSRPINSEQDRAAVVAALESVSAVCLFTDRSAQRFLAHARPDVWAKGADYTLESLNQDERRTVESAGGRIEFVTLVPGRSTTGTIQRLAAKE